MTKQFVLLYQPGPKWLTGKPVTEQPLEDHLDYVHNLYTDGIVQMGGPFDDNSGGMGIVRAGEIAKVQGLVDWIFVKRDQ